MCGYHANEKSNEDILELYKKNVIRANGKFNDFTQDVKISNFSESYNNRRLYSEDSSIFAFQTIDVEGLLLKIFYDSGCGDLVVTKESVQGACEAGVFWTNHS